MQLQDKVALITGGTHGIGRGVAEAYLREGTRVAINGRSKDKGAQALAEMDAGDRAIFLAADVLNSADVDGLVDGTVEQFGGILDGSRG
jgi:3-hydroxybutyrate dehydrogenase